MGQIFSDEAAKMCDKCRQMHYVGEKLCNHCILTPYTTVLKNK